MTEHRHWRQDKDSPYLAATDMLEADMVVKIKSVGQGDVFNKAAKRNEKRRVIEFDGDVKPMVCNTTNAESIEKVLGTGYYDEWVGQKIQLYAAPEIRSDSGFAIRVREFKPE